DRAPRGALRIILSPRVTGVSDAVVHTFIAAAVSACGGNGASPPSGQPSSDRCGDGVVGSGGGGDAGAAEAATAKAGAGSDGLSGGDIGSSISGGALCRHSLAALPCKAPFSAEASASSARSISNSQGVTNLSRHRGKLRDRKRGPIPNLPPSGIRRRM